MVANAPNLLHACIGPPPTPHHTSLTPKSTTHHIPPPPHHKCHCKSHNHIPHLPLPNIHPQSLSLLVLIA